MGLRGLSSGPERTDFRPKGADLGPERGLRGTDGRMDGRQEIPLGPPPKKLNLTDVQTIRVHATKNR